ncbi:NACHT domain-containing protein [Asanoa iriomotensis]|uniref:NACHT domain-containing protein n=1 Tax=Asanoa iriomotensis TaxID=234613 RepID=A0ABQ4CAL3_9ACTN|nr:hypothetical protein [Asanoa iriomotensis]GIF59827.1 hypothetical protein Air01nite_59220 [Asanoa iriomotensis]
MSVTVLIAHARGEEDRAEELAGPIRAAGYTVHHGDTVLVGDSVVRETQKLLNAGGPVVLCGTIRAMGTSWARRVVNAARDANRQNRVFVVQMEEDADTDAISLDGKVAAWWRNPEKAAGDLVAALVRYFPLDQRSVARGLADTAEARYRALALESCDLVDLANLPETDRHIALRQLELRRLYVALRVRPLPAKSLGESLERLELAGAHGPVDGGRTSIGQRLGEARRLVVLGDPGAGKSTLLRWITTAYLLRLAEDPDWRALPDVGTLPDADLLPVLIRCRDLRPEHIGGAFDEILNLTLRQQEMTDAECSALRGVIRDRLTAGTALVLLDGLDEITDPSLRIRLCRQIERVAGAYPLAPIITTCRIVGYREMDYRMGRGFEHVVVDELEPADKDDFAARWCALVEPPDRRAAATAELVADVHSTPQIEALTGNPMLLTTMALVKRKIGKLPSRRADLYWEAVQVLLNWRREVDVPLDPREAMPQLEYLAYAMCARGVQRLREDEVLDLLAAMRDEFPQVHSARNHEPTRFLELVERRTGLLMESGEVKHKGRPVPVYEFRHLTFQEYLAARALVEGHHPGHDPKASLAELVVPLVDSAEAHKTRESWHEPVRLCVASCNDADAEAILRQLLTQAEEDLRGQDWYVGLTLKCLADEPNVSTGILHEALGARIRMNSFMSNEMTELLRSRWCDDSVNFVAGECDGSWERDSDLVWDLCNYAPTGPMSPSDLRRRLSGPDFADRLRTAFAIMQLGSHGNVDALAADLDGLTDDLVALTHGRRPLPMMAVWALGWLYQSPSSDGVPTRLASRFADLFRAEQTEPAVIRFLLWFAHGTIRFADAADLDAVHDAMLTWFGRAAPSDALLALADVEWGNVSARRKLAHLGSQVDDAGVRAALVRLREVQDLTELQELCAYLAHEHDPTVWAAAVASLAALEWSEPPLTGHRDLVHRIVDTFVPGTEESAIHLDLIRADLDDAEARKRLMQRLHGREHGAAGRRNALAVVAESRFDETDRRLVGVSRSEPGPLDPMERISVKQVRERADRVRISEDEARRRYERLAQRWGLRLAWS